MSEALQGQVLSTAEGPLDHAVLRHVRWETYEALLSDHLDSRWPRFVYDDGILEIMTPSSKHDRIGVRVQKFIDIVTEEWGLEMDNVGHATMRRKDLRKGFEADASIYLQNAERVRRKENIDLNVDPPPDLVLETEVSRSALDKLALYARFGVPEVWRVDETSVAFHILQGNSYFESSSSFALPGLTSRELLEFLQAWPEMKSLEWTRNVREWANSRRPKSE